MDKQQNYNWQDITTWEQVCAVKGIDPKQLPDVSWMPEDMKAYMVSAYKMPFICDVINEDHEFDWTSYNERKYLPLYNLDDETAPLGFSYLAFGYAYTFTSLGARHHLKDLERMEHLNKHFFNECRDVTAKPPKA